MDKTFWCQRENKGNNFGILILFILAIGAMVTLCSCAGVRGSTKTFDGLYQIELEKPRSDIFKIVEEVGKSMSFSVSEVNDQIGKIVLSPVLPNISEPATSESTGKSDQCTIAVTRKGDGKVLEVEIMTFGNFGNGARETADKLFSDFKDKLSKHTRITLKEEKAKEVKAPPTLAKKAELSNETGPSKLFLKVIKSGNIRSNPSTSSKIIAKVKKGEKLQGQGKSGDWYSVILPSGENGWVFKSLVKVVD